MVLLSKLIEAMGGKALTAFNDVAVSALLTDSRKIYKAEDALFFAIPGDNHDGHTFIQEAYKAGVRTFVVEHEMVFFGQLSGTCFIKVENSVHALQEAASYKRQMYHYPVVAITGSNAKTTVKEWLSQMLSFDHIVVKSPKSYNSQIGVPLSVWQMEAHHTLGIFEAGISMTGEMEKLEKVIRPTLGIITNIGPAHDEGFESTLIKIQEKLKVFSHVDAVVYCREHEEIDNEIQTQGLKSFAWSAQGKQAEVQFILHSYDIDNPQYSVKVYVENIHIELELKFPFGDPASVENLMHCISAMIYFKVNAEEIQPRLNQLSKISMRLELKQGLHNCSIVDDSYNNDLAGLAIALDFLDQQTHQPKKTLILSDLYETGQNPTILYGYIAGLVQEKKIARVIGIGEQISAHLALFNGVDRHFYAGTNDFLALFNTMVFNNEAILIKGSRVFEFEKIVSALQQKSHRTVLEINLDALTHNLNFYRGVLEENTKIMVMVKSFAYGSGSLEVTRLLQFHKVDYLAVAYADEGALLRENGIVLPIMVMSPSPESFHTLFQYKLEPAVYSLEVLEELVGFLESTGSNMDVHLEIETGMHRLGIGQIDLPKAIQLIKNSGRIKVVSIFSHLSAADDNHHALFTKGQYSKLMLASAFIEHGLGYTAIKHILNSAGIIAFPEFQLDMVRLGIGLYGVEATGQAQQKLQPVSTLKSVILQVKTVQRGETVGYSRKGNVAEGTKIGIVAIGYGDGYSRAFSNGVGRMLVNGKQAPIVGNVCMDMTMIDLTGIEAGEGDEVEIFGKGISIIDLAAKIGTIPYELLTGVGQRVKRVFYSE